jgi:hypothetical protein
MSYRIRAAALLMLSVLTGCHDSPLGPGNNSSRVPSNNSSLGSSDYVDRIAFVGAVTAPDIVTAGDAFEVTMISLAGDGCSTPLRDEVKQTGPLEVTITPIDQVYVGPGVCTENAPQFRHSVSLLARTPGALEVNVMTQSAGGVAVIRRTVMVQ